MEEGCPPTTSRRFEVIRQCGAAAGLLAAIVPLAGCAARRFAPPTDAGTPLANVSEIHAAVSEACTSVRTLSVELGLSGRAGPERLRGRLNAGFERPSSMRLEGLGPFGPVFILVAGPGEATLLLRRESRVVRSASASDILGALTGVALAPADLQAILTGCVVPSPRPAAGQQHAGRVLSIGLDGGATLYVESGPPWRVRAARRDGWEIEYPMWQGLFPQVVRLRSTTAQTAVDVTARLVDVQTNIALAPDAFAVTVPAGAAPLTLDELRDAGPLRGQP